MSHLASGVLGTIAGVLALGAVHLEVAAGNDLLGPAQRGDASLQQTIDRGVNRDAKSDRQEIARNKDGVTISFRVPGNDNTSVLMRVSSDPQLAKRAPQPTATNVPMRPKIACEPMVSPLTSGAKELQPGRCIT